MIGPDNNRVISGFPAGIRFLRVILPDWKLHKSANAQLVAV